MLGRCVCDIIIMCLCSWAESLLLQRVRADGQMEWPFPDEGGWDLTPREDPIVVTHTEIPIDN